MCAHTSAPQAHCRLTAHSHCRPQRREAVVLTRASVGAVSGPSEVHKIGQGVSLSPSQNNNTNIRALRGRRVEYRSSPPTAQGPSTTSAAQLTVCARLLHRSHFHPLHHDDHQQRASSRDPIQTPQGLYQHRQARPHQLRHLTRYVRLLPTCPSLAPSPSSAAHSRHQPTFLPHQTLTTSA